MAITLWSTNQESMDLKDFCEFVDKNYKSLNVESMIDLASKFKALANNPYLLENIVLEELKNIDQFQISNPYSSQSLSLHIVPGKFFVRANLWLPKQDFHKINGTGEQRLFAYYQPHDHNFDFMTIGYYGSGYHTDIYEYDHATVQGYIGESVDIRYLETTALEQGKIMIYRGSTDIHTQKFPEEFSISLNLMAPSLLPARDQFMFDLDNSKIRGIIRSNYSGRKLLLEAAGYLANDNISDLLESIAKSHKCARTRETAKEALSKRWPRYATAIS